MFDTHKTRLTGLPCGEETMTIMLIYFDRVLQREEWTEGYINIACKYADTW